MHNNLVQPVSSITAMYDCKKMAKHLSQKHFFKQPNSSGASDKCDEKTGNDGMGRKDRQLSVIREYFQSPKDVQSLPVNVDPKLWIDDNV